MENINSTSATSVDIQHVKSVFLTITALMTVEVVDV